jgi:tetratricopeptide (TPR) repeat protein
MQLVASAKPAPPEIATRLAAARILLARLLLDGGDSRGAADAAREAVGDWRSQLAARPEDLEARLGLASALNEAGRVLLVCENALEARQSHLEAVALLDALPPGALSPRDIAMQLYTSHQYSGRGFEFTGEFESAVEQYQIGVEQASRYSAANPSDIVARHAFATLQMDLGRSLRKMDCLDQATAAFERARAILEEVVEWDPGHHYVRSDLAACHGFLGRVHEVEGNLQAALDEFRADVAINEQLVAIEPENGSWNLFHADALTKEGRVLMRLGRLEEAEIRHRRALDLRQRALDARDQDAMAQTDVAESLLELGRVETRKGFDEAARSAWRRAAELLEATLRTSDFVMHRLRFARTLLELGDTERARPVVERLLRERCNEPELLELCERRGVTA